MPINVISKIKPINNGQFPVVEDVDIHGGLQIRADITDRNSIPTDNRKIGMVVYVVADGKFYALVGGTDNANWSQTLSGSQGAPFEPAVRTVTGPISNVVPGPTDCMFNVDTTAGVVSFLLSTALDTGQILIFKDVSGTAATNNIQIQPDFPDEIDSTNVIINQNWGSVIIQRQASPTTSVWGVVASYPPPSGGGGTPTGAAGGDLSGTYPDPDVAAIRGAPIKTPAVFNTGLIPGQVLAVSTGAFAQPIAIDTTSDHYYVGRLGYNDILRFPGGSQTPNLSLTLDGGHTVENNRMLFAAGNLWLAVSSQPGIGVLRIDATTGHVIANIALGGSSGDHAMAFNSVNNILWIVSGQEILSIDVLTNTVTSQVNMPHVIADLIYANGFLWAGDEGSSGTNLYKLDPITGATLNTTVVEASGVNLSVTGFSYNTSANKIYAVNAGGGNQKFYRFHGTTGALELTFSTAPYNVYWTAFNAVTNNVFVSSNSDGGGSTGVQILIVTNPNGSPFLQHHQIFTDATETMNQIVYDPAHHVAYGVGHDYIYSSADGGFGPPNVQVHSITGTLGYQPITTVTGVTLGSSQFAPLGSFLTLTAATNASWQPLSQISSQLFDFAGGQDGFLIDLPSSELLRDGTVTTDNTPTPSFLVFPQPGQLVRVMAEVLAKRTDVIGDAAWFVLKAVYLDNGGVLSVVKAPTVVDSGSTAGASAWTATITTSGSFIQITVTGENGKTIHWSVVREVVEAV